jgi:hypothetical protein
VDEVLPEFQSELKEAFLLTRLRMISQMESPVRQFIDDADWPMVLLAGLAMSLGWGIRGDYGHEAGAMLPGALVALACVVGSGRADWLARATVLALLGALGWAIGGQMSYGIVIGYTADGALANVLYGLTSLFLIGALWGAIGAGLLGLGVTWGRAALESMVLPLSTLYGVWLVFDGAGWTDRLSARWSLHDTDWVAAITALAVGLGFHLSGAARWRPSCGLMVWLATGWLAGYALLTALLGLRMTPPRSDNWAGCVGLAGALVLFLWRERNRAALLLLLYGGLAGGLGFAVGDAVQMLGRAEWGPVGQFSALQNLDFWKWMERLFGLIMGMGVALGLRRLARVGVTPVEAEPIGSPLRGFSLIVLLLVMPWHNFDTNLRFWLEKGHLGDSFLEISPKSWVLAIASGLTVVGLGAIRLHLQDRLHLVPASRIGRVQLLFLSLLWLFVVGDFTKSTSLLQNRAVLSVHVSFWVTALLVTLLLLFRDWPISTPPASSISAGDQRWFPGRGLLLGWLAVPFLLLALTSLLLMTRSGALPGSRQRFEPPSSSRSSQLEGSPRGRFPVLTSSQQNGIVRFAFLRP